MANVKTIPATVMLRRGSSQKRELRGLKKNQWNWKGNNTKLYDKQQNLQSHFTFISTLLTVESHKSEEWQMRRTWAEQKVSCWRKTICNTLNFKGTTNSNKAIWSHIPSKKKFLCCSQRLSDPYLAFLVFT